MIRVRFQRDPNGNLCGFQVRGHADFDEEGLDIVCAAVSALAEGIARGLELQLGPQLSLQQRKGFLICMLPAPIPPRRRGAVKALLETLRVSLSELAGAYPDYVLVEDKQPAAAKNPPRRVVPL